MSIINTLVEQFPIRRSKAQKEAFRDWFIAWAREQGYTAQATTPRGQCHSTNVFVGDPESASVIFTAHYDTPAGFFLPNLMTPRNRLFFWMRQIGMILLLILFGALAGVPAGLLTGNEQIGILVGYVVYMGLLFLMLYGPANKNNVNDNTSGVAAIMELMMRIPAENRAKTAFILFDDEEKGLLGSKAYAKAHPQVKEKGFVVNLDCVGDGDHVLLLCGKKAREDARCNILTEAMAAQTGRELHIFPLEKSVYNSDQKNFKVSSAICACRQGKHIGFYCDKIHTGKDTVCDQTNLDFLAEGLARFVAGL